MRLLDDLTEAEKVRKASYKSDIGLFLIQGPDMPNFLSDILIRIERLERQLPQPTPQSHSP